jgi:hypothetical protein
MKVTWLLFAAIVMLSVGAAYAQGPTQQQEAAPKLAATLDEMKQQHVLLGTEPQGAVKCFMDAVFVYMNEETRDQGREMLQYLAMPLMSDTNWDRLPGNRLFVERMVNPQFHHIWRSYAKGTSPDNGYQMDPNNWELNFERTHRHDDDDRGLQVYLRSSGADNPRVVYVKQSTTSGLWYLNIWHTLFVGVKPPVDPTQEVFK